MEGNLDHGLRSVYADDESLALMHNAVSVDVLTLRRSDLTERGLYELLRVAGHVPRTANQIVVRRRPPPAQAKLPERPRRGPLLTMTSTAWDSAGRERAEYGSHICRARRYPFELDLTS
jgi:DNA-binding GntR family transcriptional regulator